MCVQLIDTIDHKNIRTFIGTFYEYFMYVIKHFDISLTL